MDNLIKQLEAFVPYNEQEERDLSVMLDWAKSGADVLTRKNKTAHFSASAWIVSPNRKSTLMCFHNIYNSWSWMGGHADGDADLKHVVVKEIGEECGLSPDKLHFLDDGISGVTMDRPGFVDMIRQLEQGKAAAVFVKDYCAIIGLNQKDLENQGILA